MTVEADVNSTVGDALAADPVESSTIEETSEIDPEPDDGVTVEGDDDGTVEPEDDGEKFKPVPYSRFKEVNEKFKETNEKLKPLESFAEYVNDPDVIEVIHKKRMQALRPEPEKVDEYKPGDLPPGYDSINEMPEYDRVIWLNSEAARKDAWETRQELKKTQLLIQQQEQRQQQKEQQKIAEIAVTTLNSLESESKIHLTDDERNELADYANSIANTATSKGQTVDPASVVRRAWKIVVADKTARDQETREKKRAISESRPDASPAGGAKPAPVKGLTGKAAAEYAYDQLMQSRK